MFYDVLISWGTLESGKRLPLPSPALDTVNSLSASLLFMHKPTHFESIPPTTSLSVTYQANISSAVSQPREGQALDNEGQSLRPQSPLELFKLASPELFTLPCLALCTETPIKAVLLSFSSLSAS